MKLSTPESRAIFRVIISQAAPEGKKFPPRLIPIISEKSKGTAEKPKPVGTGSINNSIIGIKIKAVGVFVDTARLHVSDPKKALAALQENGYTAESQEVLRTSLPNQTGALMKLTQKLGNAGINIKYLYGTMEDKQKSGMIVLEVDKPDLAINIFKNHKF